MKYTVLVKFQIHNKDLVEFADEYKKQLNSFQIQRDFFKEFTN
jgi:hypothetical protein